MNDTVLQADAWPNRSLYLVQNGSCKVLSGKGKLLWQLSKGDSFGAMGFFLNCSTNKYTVVASDDNTKIRVVEGYFLDLLAFYKPRLVASFYCYIATELTHKIQALYRTSADSSLRASNGMRAEEDDVSSSSTELSSNVSPTPRTMLAKQQSGTSVVHSPSPTSTPASAPLRDSYGSVINISVPRRERKNSRGTPTSPRTSNAQVEDAQ